jgi:hypothetical protein
MSIFKSSEISVIHFVTFEGFSFTEVAVKIQIGQVVLEQITGGHGKVIVTAIKQATISVTNKTHLGGLRVVTQKHSKNTNI